MNCETHNWGRAWKLQSSECIKKIPLSKVHRYFVLFKGFRGAKGSFFASDMLPLTMWSQKWSRLMDHGPWLAMEFRRSLQVCPIDTCWACSLPKMMPFEIWRTRCAHWSKICKVDVDHPFNQVIWILLRAEILHHLVGTSSYEPVATEVRRVASLRYHLDGLVCWLQGIQEETSHGPEQCSSNDA